jgi:hypothetical protein
MNDVAGPAEVALVWLAATYACTKTRFQKGVVRVHTCANRRRSMLMVVDLVAVLAVVISPTAGPHLFGGLLRFDARGFDC